jgi:hypothetical protein
MACKSYFSFIWLKDWNHSSEQPNLLAYICKFSEINSWKGETVVHIHSDSDNEICTERTERHFSIFFYVQAG